METRSWQQSALPLTRNADAIRPLPAEERREVKCASQAAPTSCHSLRMVYRITGAFFFGAASAIGSVLDGIADRREAFVVDFAAVPFLDSTAANVLGRVAAKAHRQGIRLFITGHRLRFTARCSPMASRRRGRVIARPSRAPSPTSRVALRSPRPMRRARPSAAAFPRRPVRLTEPSGREMDRLQHSPREG